MTDAQRAIIQRGMAAGAAQERRRAADNRRIASYLNTSGAYEAIVTLTPRGYVVQIVDIDAGARAYAIECMDDGDEELSR